MVLSEQDKASELWKNLVEHFQDLLSKAHKSNEKNLNTEETAQIRGRIKLIRDLLKLGNDHNKSAINYDN